MKNKFGTITVSGALIFAHGSPSDVQEGIQNVDDNKNKSFIFKEELIDLGLPANIVFVDPNGNSRLLDPTEQVEVKKHEEEGNISFTTFDNYSIRVPKNLLLSPRNVSGETPF